MGIQEGWADTKKKAQDRLKLLQDTKEAWVGYAENNETIAAQFEVAEEEIKLVKKRYNLEDALSDMKKRQDLYNKSNDTISGLFKAINDNFTCMSITLPEDKKKNVVVDLIAKGKVILEHPDKPKFLEGNVKRIQEGWDDTKKKAQDRLKLLLDNTVTELNSW